MDSNLTWHVLGTRDDVQRRAPFSVDIDDYSVAVFFHEGQLRAIGNRCNHKGGPLCEGTVTGEYVKCPWHGWEYSVVTGRGPTGYDEEQVPTFSIRDVGGLVSVATPPTMPGRLIDHKPSHLLEEHLKPANSPPRVLGISTTAMDDTNPRFSTSDILLQHALAHAGTVLKADTQLIRLRELAFRHCEGNYSKAARACTWPCAITERDPGDQLTAVYEGLVHWADVVIIATPIRWGRASSLYFKMTERLNCVQNQVTIADNVLIKNKVAAFIITGGQDNVQEVAGGMLTFWSELGFMLPQFPFIAHTRGWDAEDMENNVRLVRASDALRSASGDLVARALLTWRMIDEHRTEMEQPMQRTGRKAQRLNRPGQVMA